MVFWKFTNNAKSDDSDDTPKSGSRLLFRRGYSVFNAAQIDRSSPKADLETPIEQAEVFSRGINARVAHQGNRVFSSPADDIITLPPFAAFFTPLDYYPTRAHETSNWTQGLIAAPWDSASAIAPAASKNQKRNWRLPSRWRIWG